MKTTHRSILAALVLLSASVARAQQPPPDAPPRLEATAQAALLATSGNASTQSLGFAGDMTFRPNHWIYTGKAAFAQTEDDDVLSARSFASLFRADRILSAKLSAYGQYDYLHDLFAAVEHRNTLQGGLSYLALDTAPQRLRFDGGLGYEHEDRLDAAATQSAVLVGALRYRWQISATTELNEEARATLPFPDAELWKFDQTFSVTAAINSIFSLKVSNILRFVNEPVPGFEQTDTITAVSLVMKVRRPAS